MKRGENASPVPSELYSVAKEGILTSAEGVFDYDLLENLKDINLSQILFNQLIRENISKKERVVAAALNDLNERLEVIRRLSLQLEETQTLNYETISSELDNLSNEIEDVIEYIDNKILDLVNNAPEALNTLKEIADFLDNDESVAGGIVQLLSRKANSSDVYTKSEVNERFQEKGNYLTEHQDISGKANSSDVYTKTEVNQNFVSNDEFSDVEEVISHALTDIDSRINDVNSTINYIDEKTTVRDYSKEYFTFDITENGTISFDYYQNLNTDKARYMEYSTDGGETWIKVNNVDSQTITITINVSNGDLILWRGDNDTLGMFDEDEDNQTSSFFSSTCEFNVKGNIMSLLHGNNFENKTTVLEPYVFFSLFCDYYLGEKTCNVVNAKNLILPITTLTIYCYANMFDGCSSLVTAPELPATTLTDYCYRNMFFNCINLIKTPDLPATTLADDCYYNMFYGCTNLTTASKLPATTLTTSCYSGMFFKCVSLTTAPELPAMTLTRQCYSGMFGRCTSLTVAPELPATILAELCYNGMFLECTNLNYIKCLATDISANNCINNWVNNVAPSGTFIKNNSTQWSITGSSGIPTGWNAYTESEYLIVRNYLISNLPTITFIQW